MLTPLGQDREGLTPEMDQVGIIPIGDGYTCGAWGTEDYSMSPVWPNSTVGLLPARNDSQ
jgi:hypothetical protein